MIRKGVSIRGRKGVSHNLFRKVSKDILVSTSKKTIAYTSIAGTDFRQKLEALRAFLRACNVKTVFKFDF